MLPNDLLDQVNRVEETLLECISLAESTLNAKEQDTFEAKFNKGFDNFMNGLEPLALESIQINLEFLYPNDDREFINYLNNFETPDKFDGLEEWSDDIDLFMESLINPDKIEELWHISKAKKMWDDLQLHEQHEQQRSSQPAAQRNYPTTIQIVHASAHMAPQARMGLPPPEPTYYFPNIPFG